MSKIEQLNGINNDKTLTCSTINALVKGVKQCMLSRPQIIQLLRDSREIARSRRAKN